MTNLKILIVFWIYGIVGTGVLLGSVIYNFFVSPIDITWVSGVTGPFTLSVALGCVIILISLPKDKNKKEDQHETEQKEE